MHVSVVGDRNQFPGITPSLTLFPGDWDDYGLRTTFHATLWLSSEERIDLLGVKIMQLGMKQGSPNLPQINDNGLPEEFASLGSDYSYYEKVFSLPAGICEDVIISMHDLAVNPIHLEKFSKDDAFRISLTRLAPAKDALDRVKRLRMSLPARAPNSTETGVTSVEIVALQILAGLAVDEPPAADEPKGKAALPLAFTFLPLLKPNQQFEPAELRIDFAASSKLPSNLVALVGPNGTGKTTLLSGLALAVFFGGETEEPRGRVNIRSGSVRDVIFVSFSAYDSFEIPRMQALSDDARADLAGQGYVYIGLRKLSQEDADIDRRERNHTLKSIREIDEEFLHLLDQLNIEASPTARSLTPDRRALFAKAMKALFEDPSMLAMAALPSTAKPEDVIRLISPLFQTMSTGHKAIMNIVASLCVHLNTNSLVLIDEPEAHLHPPLVASLLRIIRMLLRSFDANAIVATHSPIVVQETLGEHVITFRRVANRTNWEVHPSQTFGENVAALTRSTFGLPAAMADFISVLRGLTAEQEASLESIEALFGERGLSSPARAQVLRLLAAHRIGQVE